ncbi:MAG: YbbR-like domain-containing protein [Flavobacteriaceae bacterium]|nr:YbbR-like domain-containing protein [Flavobacteriaceae bacterium]
MIRRKIDKFMKSGRINIFLLFVLLALLFSLLTKLSRDYTQTLSMDLRPVNVPEDKVIVKDSLQKINVTLSTYGFKLIRYAVAKPIIDIDFSALDNDETYYYWTQQREFSKVVDQFDPNVRIETINPDTLKFRYDTNAVQKVPVILDANIKFSSGFDIIDSIQLEPDSIRVIGPSILIDTVSTIKTRPLTLEDINSDITELVDLIPPDNVQISLSDQQVTVKAKVEKFTEGSVQVPVIVKNVPEDTRINIYPKTVEVIYYASLNEFKDIVPNSFIVECDYGQTLESDINFLVPKLSKKPDKVKQARLGTKRIEFILQ